ncbi:hypothetical protein BC831DRAFT_224126 [Entophlyctis helioformis]|nr:hypothetical protein BC831DRAFT_224126 [Entophlyctis helioformis]
MLDIDLGVLVKDVVVEIRVEDVDDERLALDGRVVAGRDAANGCCGADGLDTRYHGGGGRGGRTVAVFASAGTDGNARADDGGEAETACLRALRAGLSAAGVLACSGWVSAAANAAGAGVSTAVLAAAEVAAAWPRRGLRPAAAAAAPTEGDALALALALVAALPPPRRARPPDQHAASHRSAQRPPTRQALARSVPTRCHSHSRHLARRSPKRRRLQDQLDIRCVMVALIVVVVFVVIVFVVDIHMVASNTLTAVAASTWIAAGALESAGDTTNMTERVCCCCCCR